MKLNFTIAVRLFLHKSCFGARPMIHLELEMMIMVTTEWWHLDEKGQMSPNWTMFVNWILSAYLNLFDLGWGCRDSVLNPWCILKWGFAKMKMSLILIMWQTLKYRRWRHYLDLYFWNGGLAWIDGQFVQSFVAKYNRVGVFKFRICFE